VLRLIGETAGFEVDIKGDLSIPVTRSIVGVRLDKAIDRLVGEISWAMNYSPLESGQKEASPSALHVYARRTTDTELAAIMAPTVTKNNSLVPGSSPEIAMKTILKNLAQTDRDVRMQAVGQLGRLKDENSIDILTQVLFKDQDATVRRHAVITLGKIGGVRTTEALANVSLDDPDETVREAAISALTH